MSKSLDKIEAALHKKWQEWLKIYEADVSEDGIAAVVEPGTKEAKVWNELVNLRKERNDLLNRLREEGKNI